MYKKFKKAGSYLSVALVTLMVLSGQAMAVLSAEATAAQTAVEGLITDMAGLGWSIATALVVAMAGIGLFLKFTRKGGAR